jgi:hypothetical protein
MEFGTGSSEPSDATWFPMEPTKRHKEIFALGDTLTGRRDS